MLESINSKINSDLNAIIRTVSGELTATDIKSVFDGSLGHSDFK